MFKISAGLPGHMFAVIQVSVAQSAALPSHRDGGGSLPPSRAFVPASVGLIDHASASLEIN